MTAQPTTTEPTLQEKVHALEVTARRLVAERDCALGMASRATKDLVRVQRESKAQLTLRENIVSSLRIDADSKNDDIRRLTARVHELALANEDLQARLDREQQETPVRRSWWSARIGNRL